MEVSEVYTVEFNGSKGWEIYSMHKGLTEAISVFRKAVLADTEVQWRLVTPEVTDR